MKKARKIICVLISVVLMFTTFGIFSVNAENAEKEYYKAGYLLSMDNDEFLALDGAEKEYEKTYYDMAGFYEEMKASGDKFYTQLAEGLGEEETRLFYSARIFNGRFGVSTYRNDLEALINDLFSDVDFEYTVERKTGSHIRYNLTTVYYYTVTVPSLKSKYTSDEDIMNIAKINYCLSQISINNEGSPRYDLYDCITIAEYVMNPELFDEDEMLLYDYNNNGITNIYDAIAIAYTFM
ncbi:MAG TPA: hypothetical protein DCS12_08030 [Clostridiales bacterium]|nr:hypothetical protein [Clostridiales bacterium]